MRGDADAVEPGFVAAERGFRELHTPFDLAVAQLEHAEWLVGQGRTRDADELLSEAREEFERLRALPWLERLERSTGSLPAAAAMGEG
jgi:hypothetical protein